MIFVNELHKQQIQEEVMSTLITNPDVETLKVKLRATWMSGDYDLFSRYMEDGARIFYEGLDVPAGCQLLDVACGSGQLALWAARDGVKVTGVDIVKSQILIAQGHKLSDPEIGLAKQEDVRTTGFALKPFALKWCGQ